MGEEIVKASRMSDSRFHATDRVHEHVLVTAAQAAMVTQHRRPAPVQTHNDAAGTSGDVSWARYAA